MPLRSSSPRTRFHVLPSCAGTRWTKLVRLWAHSGVQPAVTLRLGERSDACPACATVSYESQVLPPTRVCHLTAGTVDRHADMARVMPLPYVGYRHRALVDCRKKRRLLALCLRVRRESLGLGRCSVRQRPRVLGAWGWRCANGPKAEVDSFLRHSHRWGPSRRAIHGKAQPSVARQREHVLEVGGCFDNAL